MVGVVSLQGLDTPGVLEKLCDELARMNLDITALSANQAVFTRPGSPDEEKRFTITGMVRAFAPRDIAALRSELEAFEPSWRVGIHELDPSPNFSAFTTRTPQIRPPPKLNRRNTTKSSS